MVAALTAHMFSIFNLIVPACPEEEECAISLSIAQDVNCTFVTLLIVLVALTYVSR